MTGNNKPNNDMDKGAHFYKCDFQVHTPRDERWSGGDAVTDAERKAYAEELVLACRRKGLHGIAITDHHDVAFFQYVKEAASAELDDAGRPVPDAEKLVVFPGIELTLTAPPCQALLILDADFPLNLLPSVLTALAVTPSAATDSKNAPVQRIPQTVVNNLSDLYNKLNSHIHLKGRFTVLPNVTETGYGTLLRSGFADFYKSMPCVGGYTDGPVPSPGTGAHSILRGEDRNYGFKPIAVFQTSDNRQRDHAALGTYTTWVKWSEPTAEALRQACLAKESRLSQTEPDLPAFWISSMSVSNSKFLSRVEVDFNRQYNAVIGGRGTGKSTILEYLRWGLCDQPVDNTGSDIAPVQVKRGKLIDDTLEKVEGEVSVTFLLNDVRHIVKRNSRTQEILLKIGDAAFRPATEAEVRNLLPVQAYSQKQLSSVGIRIDELKRFVELPIRHVLDQIRSDIRDSAAKIRAAYMNVSRKREIEAELAAYAIETDSLAKQLETLRKELKGLSAADQKIIGQKPRYDNEELIVERLRNELEQAQEAISALSSHIGDASDEEGGLEVENTELIERIRAGYEARFGEIREKVADLEGLFGGAAIAAIEADVAKWTEAKDGFEKKYEAAKARASANQEQLRQVHETEKRIGELNRLQMTGRNALAKLGDPEASYAVVREKWDAGHRTKLQAIDDQCQKFSGLSNGLIRATTRGGLAVDALKQSIKRAVAGLNVRDQKVDDLCERVRAAADPVAEWGGILADFERLALYKAGGATPIPMTPTLESCGFVESERKRLAAGLDSLKWLDLALTEVEFNPLFEYCTSKDTGEYIEFADASAGQQATALLTVLLNQQGAPLIIDQPEEDVDSKMSPELVQQIWDAKKHRQLIFASHNANFVVNGDAELVICCDYVRAGTQTGGEIKAAGAIDNRAIREEITTVTEGGPEAFKLRMAKYGF